MRRKQQAAAREGGDWCRRRARRLELKPRGVGEIDRGAIMAQQGGDTNDSLRLASLWHSMHAISQQLSPTPGCEGIDLLQAHNFDLHCFQSLTGTKFFAVCETGAQNIEVLLKVIYELYTDFVLKNPFYEMEMPIRCELFDLNLVQVLQKDRVALLGR
uniref:Trafficking protein particle complex subunit n=1 Tax=Leersia perrieri TaxID=77586 RepID=A0A0D9WFU1_9ORYZ